MRGHVGVRGALQRLPASRGLTSGAERAVERTKGGRSGGGRSKSARIALSRESVAGSCEFRYAISHGFTLSCPEGLEKAKLQGQRDARQATASQETDRTMPAPGTAQTVLQPKGSGAAWVFETPARKEGGTPGSFSPCILTSAGALYLVPGLVHFKMKI